MYTFDVYTTYVYTKCMRVAAAAANASFAIYAQIEILYLAFAQATGGVLREIICDYATALCFDCRQ